MSRIPIPGTGIFQNIPSEQYHAMDGVSNSQLKVFGNDSPAHYKAMLDGAPEDDSDLSDDERKARVLGTLSHLAILEGHLFAAGKSHHVKPDGMTFASKEGKGWREAHSDLPIISAREEKRILGALAAILAHPVAGPLLAGPGTNEASVFAVHPATGIPLRMRADRLTEDADGRPWIVDLKSCQSVKKFAWTARDFRYDVQSVFYADVLALAGVENAAFAFIAFELAPRYGIHAVRVVMPDHETQAAARNLYESELLSLAKCRETDTWPQGCDGIETLTVKRWIP